MITLQKGDSDEFQLQLSDFEFFATGLKVASKVRVTKIVSIERKLITRRLGKLDNDYISTLNTKMIQAFQLSQ